MESTHTDSPVPSSSAWFTRWLEAIRAMVGSLRIHRRERSLRVCETLQLGEKRILAVVQFEGRRFLIGATNQSISLLDRLDPATTQRQKSGPSLESSFLNGVH